MHALARRAALGLALLQTMVTGGAALPSSDRVPRYFQQRAPFTRRDLSVDEIQSELGPLLSDGSSIFGPESPEFAGATERWNTFAPPDIEVVVEPSQESDVSAIVKYCNDNSIDFLAVNRGHGTTSTLGRFKGLQINLSQLNGIDLRVEDETVVLQGGAWGRDVVETLWEQGFVTTTGSGGCPGVLGPALGGGHGRLEGLHGLISDNFQHANVVLADGSAVGANASSHADLFWALKGAGHNFGIVTSVRLPVFRADAETWHFHNYAWAADQLETVFATLNEFHGEGRTPARMGANFGQISLDTSGNATEPIISWTFAYAGSADDAEALLAPFNAIASLSDQSGDVAYPGIMAAQGTDVDSPSCAANAYIGSVAGLRRYNATAERRIYELFAANLAAHPELGSGARLFYEGYATEAVTAVDPDSSAFAQRDDFHIVFFQATAMDGLVDTAEEWARQTRDLWNAGQPERQPTTYLNYAVGDEPLEALYGYEPWRLERLRDLKAQYDPQNRFRFYNPIVVQDS